MQLWRLRCELLEEELLFQAIEGSALATLQSGGIRMMRILVAGWGCGLPGVCIGYISELPGTKPEVSSQGDPEDGRYAFGPEKQTLPFCQGV